MSQDWSDTEVALVVEDYFAMLREELNGIHFSKTEHRTRLLPSLNNRTDGSVEFKYQNISAVLASLGQYYIKGYKPRSNYQQLLEDQVVRALDRYGHQLESLLEKFAQEPITEISFGLDFSNCLVERPQKSKPQKKEAIFRAVKTNYLEREQLNRTLGARGEQLFWNMRNGGWRKLGAAILFRR